jgi:hypothetical protein
VLMGEAARDARLAPVGEFAGGAVGPDEAVGSYGGARHAQGDGMGAFAGDAAHSRRGGFADADRDTVTERADGVERMRVTSHRALERLLVEAGIDPASAAADVEALHAGRVLVLATTDGVSSDTAAAALDET